MKKEYGFDVYNIVIIQTLVKLLLKVNQNFNLIMNQNNCSVIKKRV